MTTQKAALERQLLQCGWEIVAVENREVDYCALDWWEDEVWTLKSYWSPQDCLTYLTFLVDPQSDSPERKTGEGVWTVAASPQRLPNRLATNGVVTLNLGHGWQERLPTFLEELSTFRNQAQFTSNDTHA
ncbi:MAG: hypothetical protein M3371_03885 [Acidobacteriota bacterium]|nr:hypothetical protein [Acidobacteriota bacterium]